MPLMSISIFNASHLFNEVQKSAEYNVDTREKVEGILFNIKFLYKKVLFYLQSKQADKINSFHTNTTHQTNINTHTQHTDYKIKNQQMIQLISTNYQSK